MWVLRNLQIHLVYQEYQAHRDLQDLRDHRDLLDLPVILACLVLLA
jgi:hypothetical protein